MHVVATQVPDVVLLIRPSFSPCFSNLECIMMLLMLILVFGTLLEWQCILL
jgi:hypothetical protein